MTGNCSIIGCDRPVRSTGICNVHRQRLAKGKPVHTWKEHFAQRHPPYGNVAFVPLTKEKFAKVDTEDYTRLMQHDWHAYKNGRTWYAKTYIDRKPVKMHQLLCPASGDMVPDHRNRDGLDNRKENLRLCTRSHNCQNTRKCGSATSSRFIGVSARKGRYFAQIRHQGKKYHLGTFDTEEEAAAAYNAKAIELYGPDARLNGDALGAIKTAHSLLPTP